MRCVAFLGANPHDQLQVARQIPFTMSCTHRVSWSDMAVRAICQTAPTLQMVFKSDCEMLFVFILSGKWAPKAFQNLCFFSKDKSLAMFCTQTPGMSDPPVSASPLSTRVLHHCSWLDVSHLNHKLFPAEE